MEKKDLLNGLISIPREYNSFCLKIRGAYKKELESYIAQCVKEIDTFIGSCTCVLEQEPTIGLGFVIRCSHNREHYHNPKKEDILRYFLEFLETNHIGECHYCGDTINKRTSNSFCGKDICTKCESIGKELIIKRQMEKDLDEWGGK